MGKKKLQDEPEPNFIQIPLVGTVLTILSGLSFLFLCMILPLVGQAGAAAPHAPKNTQAFLAVLLVSLGLGAVAVYSKVERRKLDNSPLPYFSMGLCGICVLLLLTFLAGFLKI